MGKNFRLSYPKKNSKHNFRGVDVPDGFSCNSGNNIEWETIESLRDLVIKHVDINFKP